MVGLLIIVFSAAEIRRRHTKSRASPWRVNHFSGACPHEPSVDACFLSLGNAGAEVIGVFTAVY
jgi:hypothetical protein